MKTLNQSGTGKEQYEVASVTFSFFSRDLVAIIAVLEFNQWFTKLSTKDYKLVSNSFLEIFWSFH